MASAKITITSKYVVVDTVGNQDLVTHTKLENAIKDCEWLPEISHIRRIDTVTAGNITRTRVRILTLPIRTGGMIHDSWTLPPIGWATVPNGWWKK